MVAFRPVHRPPHRQRSRLGWGSLCTIMKPAEHKPIMPTRDVPVDNEALLFLFSPLYSKFFSVSVVINRLLTPSFGTLGLSLVLPLSFSSISFPHFMDGSSIFISGLDANAFDFTGHLPFSSPMNRVESSASDDTCLVSDTQHACGGHDRRVLADLTLAQPVRISVRALDHPFPY
jgi:hypothetical protein